MNEKILFFAFRYALGRMTYAVNEVADEILKNADGLSKRTRDQIVFEIEDAEKDGRLGMHQDQEKWREVRDRLKI